MQLPQAVPVLKISRILSSRNPNVDCSRPIQCVGEKRWAISDIVGLEDGLGVECLSGSGAIASAFSKAFKEGLTITLVSGRSAHILVQKAHFLSLNFAFTTCQEMETSQ